MRFFPYLLDSMTHPTADDIYKSLESKFPNMSVATVYNNLKVFIESGLVRELTYGDSSSRFDADMTDHYHAVCEVCGKISDFEYPPLSDIETTAAYANRIPSWRLSIGDLWRMSGLYGNYQTLTYNRIPQTMKSCCIMKRVQLFLSKRGHVFFLFYIC